MADKMTCRTFRTAFKLAAIKQLKAGEAVLSLARELGVSRKILFYGYQRRNTMSA